MTSDDPFLEITQGLELPDPTDVINVRTLATVDLIRRFDNLTQALLDCEEFLDPRTQEARDMHSLRNALDVELQRRFRDPSQHIYE